MPLLTPSRFLAPSLATVLLVSAPALNAAPAAATSQHALAAAPSQSGWSLSQGEELEQSWAWRARLKGAGSGEARVAFGALGSKGEAFLRVQTEGKRATFQFWRLRNGKAEPASAAAAVALTGGGLDGELGLQASSSQVRALWDGRVVLEAWGLASSGSIAAQAKGLALSQARLQPTEAVVFSDDFMRATGPNEPEVDGSWHRASGVWKTSGLLGARADAALNPNPFVFRAEALPNAVQQQVLATVGSWFWSDYAITASVRPVLRDASAPLIVGLGAYMGDRERPREGISALVDAREGRAMLVRGAQVLATSEAFDFDPNNWHRLYFEPGPNTLRFFVDGIERVRLDTSALRSASAAGDAAQGQAALIARLSGANYADFDDVRAASSPSQSDSFRVASPGRWVDASGEWQTVASRGQRVLRSAEGLTLTGAPEREEGSVEAAFEVAQSEAAQRAAAPATVALSQGAGAASTWAGAVFAAQDAGNYFAARVRGAHLEIVQVAEGKPRLLGSALLLPMGRPAGLEQRLSIGVQWRDGVITARAGGAVANATVASIPAGRVGAVAKRGAGSSVAVVSLQALGAAPAWGEGALPERFEKDRLMKNWASNAAAWKRGADGFFWHTGDFFGDAALTLPLPEMPLGSRLALRLNADPSLSASGARLEVERVAGGWKLSLSQNGKYLGSAGLSEAEWSGAEQATDAGGKKLVRSLRFVRRPAGEGRASLRAVAGTRTVFALEASAPAEPAAIKCGVSLVAAGADPNEPRGKEITVHLTTAERDKRAVVGVQLADLTEDAQRELALGDGKGAVIQGIEPNTPAAAAGLKVDDVIRAIDGKAVGSVDEVVGSIAGKSVGASVELTIWRHLNQNGPLDWEQVAATTTQALDYSFTNAPVDWKAGAGKWAVSERWTCSPQWAFFNGSNAANPTLWSRFGAKGDWTLEAYVANPMDQTRGERSPSDLNLTVGGDGRDLSSGYSWIFGGEKRTVNRVYKGDAIALEKPFELPALLGNTHQDWFYVRLEKRQTAAGLRFKYFVNNKMLMEYADPAPLKAALEGGRFAFWTYNGALSIARARLWYSNLETAGVSASRSTDKAAGKGSGQALAASTSRPIPNPLGAWATRREDALKVTALVASEKDGARNAIKITNAQSGGDWTAYISRQPFDAAQKPVLSFDYRVPGDVKVNLYLKVEDRWREVVFTGDTPLASDGPANQRVTKFGVLPAGPSEVDSSVRIGAFANVQADGKWHRASIDLLSALKAANMSTTVQEIALAAPDQGYLRCGLGGNHAGATYWIANLNASQAAAAPAAIAQAPRE